MKDSQIVMKILSYSEHSVNPSDASVVSLSNDADPRNVSLNGVTGAGNLDTADVASRLKGIRKHVSLPVGVGFGISDAQSAQRISLVADAVVIGSKLIDTMTKACAGLPVAEQSQAAITAGADWLGHIRQAMNVARAASQAAGQTK